MNIKDIVVGTPITLHVKVGIKTIDLPVKVSKLSRTEQQQIDTYMQRQGISGVVLDVYKKDNQILSLSNKDYQITASVIKEAKHHSFEVDEVNTVRLSSSSAYYIVRFKQDEAGSSNRRESFRVDVMAKGRMTNIATKVTSDIIVKDLSAEGAGLVVGDMVETAVGQRYTVRFTAESEERFEFNVKVVRIADLGKGKKLLGCLQTTKSRSMERYLAKLQLRIRESKRK